MQIKHRKYFPEMQYCNFIFTRCDFQFTYYIFFTIWVIHCKIMKEQDLSCSV